MFAELVNSYWKDESGAVTVEWVVLTAAITGLALAVISPISQSTETLAVNTSGAISGVESGYTPD